MIARDVLRFAARLGALALAALVLGGIVAQFAHIIERNVAYATQLHDVERDVAALTKKKAEQQREIARLSDPAGAIPEIHDRLHLVGDHEGIIYLKRHDAPSSHE